MTRPVLDAVLDVLFVVGMGIVLVTAFGGLL